MTQELQSTAGSVGTPYMPELSVFSELEATYEEIAHALNGLSYDSIYFPHMVSVALLNNCLETPCCWSNRVANPAVEGSFAIRPLAPSLLRWATLSGWNVL